MTDDFAVEVHDQHLTCKSVNKDIRSNKLFENYGWLQEAGAFTMQWLCMMGDTLHVVINKQRNS